MQKWKKIETYEEMFYLKKPKPEEEDPKKQICRNRYSKYIYGNHPKSFEDKAKERFFDKRF